MFVYGPIFCLCVVSAFACAVLYNLGIFLMHEFWAFWNLVHALKDDLFGSTTGAEGPNEGSWGATDDVRSPPPYLADRPRDWGSTKVLQTKPTPATSVASSHSGSMTGHGGRKSLGAPEQSQQHVRAERVIPYKAR
ncbi:hypothetical protein BC939DRAFT_450889 [Gamsiella multidivaricata]|uniref:uncharacterized protein n=1 Tax=Gamsiella multidivaricata TaxID=101098 RepID=UPI00221E6667|nr:uncharacterized protein BC939DRAFT_450889 [Gamsiella multidivaricata]KAI7823812.1 hypothetical protein BC939DRAFT_450889 [Gamsiella multidivaricata]